MKPPVSPFDRLSPRHRECLRLTSALKTNKEIAAELGLSPGTVSNYCAEAVQILGARSRKDAARRFAAYEADPFKLHVENGWGGADSVLDDPERGRSAVDWRSWLPVRRKGSAHNDLHPGQRLGWIIALFISFVIAIGALAGALNVISGALSRLR